MVLSRSTSSSLDVLRSLAAITVVLQHAHWLNLDHGWLSAFTVEIGHGAVVVFFVLSGFVISATTRAERPASDYVIKRVARVYSVAVPALLLTVVLDSLSLSLGSSPASAYELNNPALYMALHLAFAGDLWALAINAFSDGPYWSLNYEVWYYAVFGVTVFARGWWRPLGVALVSLLMGPKLLLLLPVWLGGVAVQWLAGRWSLPRMMARVMALVTLVLLVAFTRLGWDAPVATWGKQLVEPNLPFPLRYSQWFLADYIRCLLTMGLVWSLCSAEFSLPSRVERMAFAVAGVSFSLYLVHFPLMHFLSVAVPGRPLVAVALAIAGAVGFGLIFEPQRHRVRAWLTTVVRGRALSARTW